MPEELETQPDVPPTPTEPQPTPASPTGGAGNTTDAARVNGLERAIADIQEQLAAIAQRLVPANTPPREPEQPPAPGPRWFRKVGK